MGPLGHKFDLGCNNWIWDEKDVFLISLVREIDLLMEAAWVENMTDTVVFIGCPAQFRFSGVLVKVSFCHFGRSLVTFGLIFMVFKCVRFPSKFQQSTGRAHVQRTIPGEGINLIHGGTTGRAKVERTTESTNEAGLQTLDFWSFQTLDFWISGTLKLWICGGLELYILGFFGYFYLV